MNNTDNINSDTLNSFISLKTSCDESYSKVANYYNNFAFTESDNIFFSNIYTAFNNSLKIARDNKINSQQKTNFILSLNKFNSDLEFLTQDLTPALSNIRNEKGSFNGILEDIKKKEDTLSKLNREMLNLSIPKGCDIYYNSLSDFLNIYQGYLSSINDAVLYENSKISSSKFKSEKDKKYNNATAKFNDMKDYYKKYKDSISN